MARAAAAWIVELLGAYGSVAPLPPLYAGHGTSSRNKCA